MRTTLDLDPKVLSAGRALAQQEGISLGNAISQIALRGLQATPTSRRHGFPVINPSVPSRVITSELVEAHRDDF
ncbi:MAG: hypothetical protein FWD83_02615 [Promicromonosporaceae bacterium]|nr:hypothetical protein [Promicromonosporaceae bacterium]